MTTHAPDPLESIQRLLAEQDAALDALNELACDVPEAFTVSRRALEELDALCSVAPASSFTSVPLNGLRA